MLCPNCCFCRPVAPMIPSIHADRKAVCLRKSPEHELWSPDITESVALQRVLQHKVTVCVIALLEHFSDWKELRSRQNFSKLLLPQSVPYTPPQKYMGFITSLSSCLLLWNFLGISQFPGPPILGKCLLALFLSQYLRVVTYLGTWTTQSTVA